ncbi:unnamed protein product [Parajaminaea phylloscopi]
MIIPALALLACLMLRGTAAPIQAQPAIQASTALATRGLPRTVAECEYSAYNCLIVTTDAIVPGRSSIPALAFHQDGGADIWVIPDYARVYVDGYCNGREYFVYLDYGHVVADIERGSVNVVLGNTGYAYSIQGALSCP